MTNDTSVTIPVVLPNGAKIYVQASSLEPREGTGERDVGFDADRRKRDVAAIPTSFGGVAKAIEGVAEALTATVERIKPQKMSVEFGLQIGAETSGLTALVVKGSGTASLKVTLEWSD